MLSRQRDVFGSFALVVLVLRLTDPVSNVGVASVAGGGVLAGGLGVDALPVLAGILLLGADAVGSALVPVATMRRTDSLDLALGGTGA